MFKIINDYPINILPVGKTLIAETDNGYFIVPKKQKTNKKKFKKKIESLINDSAETECKEERKEKEEKEEEKTPLSSMYFENLKDEVASHKPGTFSVFLPYSKKDLSEFYELTYLIDILEYLKGDAPDITVHSGDNKPIQNYDKKIHFSPMKGDNIIVIEFVFVKAYRYTQCITVNIYNIPEFYKAVYYAKQIIQSPSYESFLHHMYNNEKEVEEAFTAVDTVVDKILVKWIGKSFYRIFSENLKLPNEYEIYAKL